MNQIHLTKQEALDTLNEVALDKRRQSLLHGNQILWDVPKSFDHSVLPKEFDLWVIAGDDEDTSTIRLWSKW